MFWSMEVTGDCRYLREWGSPLPQSALTPQGIWGRGEGEGIPPGALWGLRHPSNSSRTPHPCCPGQDSSHCSLGTRYRRELSSGEPKPQQERRGSLSAQVAVWVVTVPSPNLFSTETELCSDDLGILCNDSNVWTWNADCGPYLSCCGERRRPSPKELA